MEYQHLVTKSNELINANFNFTLNEYRILMYAVSCVSPMNGDFPRKFQIDVKKLAELFNLKLDGLYTDIKDSISKKFFKRELTLDIEGGKRKLCHWLDSLTYHDGESYLELEFSHNAMPLLSQLKGRFTNYYLEKIAPMKSIYAVRIYEFCILEINRIKRNSCELLIDVIALKTRLEIESKYKKYSNFKARILNKAKQEINKYSDLTINFEEIKKGRTVDSIKFIIQRKDGAKPAKYVEEKQQELEFKATLHGELNTDTSPMGEDEFNHWMHKNSIKVRMSSYRVAEKVTIQLLADYGLDRIESALNYTDIVIKKGKEIKNKPAYLVNAIKEGY